MNVEDYFNEYNESFTIYVVEQRFVVGQGKDYFKSFVGKNNFVSDNNSIKKIIFKIMKKIQQHSPNIAELVGICFPEYRIVSILDAISALSKVFSVNEHQAVGPDVIDPIIIKEELITHKYISQLIALHRESILQPTIIILLKDNNFDRAKELLAFCPNGTNVKMIRNSGNCEIYKVINNGAANVTEFIDSFTRHCFSTCSCTTRQVLLSDDWKNTNLVSGYIPTILKIRSNLLYDEKNEAIPDILFLQDNLNQLNNLGMEEEQLHECYLCIMKLFKIYAYDQAGTDLNDALELAKDLNNDILLAHVYRYADFFSVGRNEKSELLEKARTIFSNNNIEDQALYCENNKLIHQFYSDKISIRKFKNMQQEAVYNVPGLVGMSIIYNNVGVAQLYTGNVTDAIECFEKGLDYSKERVVQKFGLKSNRLIALDYALTAIDEKTLISFIQSIFDNFGTERFPFITANYLINAVAITAKHYRNLVDYLFENYSINKVIHNALTKSQLGTGTLSLQIAILSTKYKVEQLNIHPISTISMSNISGIRAQFIENHVCNPIIFNAWL